MYLRGAVNAIANRVIDSAWMGASLVNDETSYEYSLDAVFGCSFLLLSLFSFYRMVRYFDRDGGGKVITAFYGLISATAAIRAIWFIIPSIYLEGSYTPTPVVALEDPRWIGILISEMLLSIGSIALYSIFILIACYWSHMLRKVDTSNDARSRIMGQNTVRRGPMETFLLKITIVTGLQITSILLYVFGRFNSEEMILADAILLTIVSITTLIEITLFSHRIRMVLVTIGNVNANSSRPQIRRILAITFAAGFFFITRVLIEVSFAVSIIMLWRNSASFSALVSHRYWDMYIALKHGAEVLVLLLVLVISTAIKTPQDRSSSSSSSGGGGGGVYGGDRRTGSVRRGSAGAVCETTPLVAPR